MQRVESQKLKIKIGTGAILLMLLLLLTVSCAIPQLRAVMNFPQESEPLCLESLLSSNDLEASGQNYEVIGGDSQLIFSLSKEEPLESVSVQLTADKNLMETGIFTLYYAKAGEGYTETNSSRPTYLEGTDTYFFEIPKDTYGTLRLDVDVDFTLQGIQLSAQPLHVESFKQPVNPIRMAVAIFLPLLIVGILFFTNGLVHIGEWVLMVASRFGHFCRQNPKKILHGALGYVLIFLVSAGGELCYYRFLDKTPSSLGLPFDFFRFLFLFAVLSTIFTFYLLRHTAAQKPEYLFLTVVLVAGTLFTAGLPPVGGVSWDDQIHYEFAAKAAVVSDGGYSQADNHMFVMNQNLIDFQNYQTSMEYGKEQDALHREGEIAVLPESAGNFYSRIGHIPAALSMQVSDALHIPFSARLFLARMSNLLVYAFVMFLAIRKLSSGKMILSVLALAPVFVFLACNFSYDYWVTAFLALGFVYYLEEIRRPKESLQTKNLLWMLGFFVLGCGPKAVYLVFLLLPLFFGKEKVRNRKKHVAICLGAFAVVGIALLSSLLLSTATGGDMRGGSDVDSAGQVAYILSNPFSYAKMLLHFLTSYWSPGLLIQNDYFVSFSYLGSGGGTAFLVCLLAVVAFTDKNEHDLASSKWWLRGVVAVGAFGGSALVATALYISFTSVGSATIAGCQLRYLFPFLFPVLSVLGSGRIKNCIDRRVYHYAVIGISGSVLFLSIWQQVLAGYY